MKPKKKQPVKARKMWAHTSTKGEVLNVSTRMMLNDAYFAQGTKAAPVFIMPATREAYDAMLEQMHRARCAYGRVTTQGLLAAIGIVQPASDAGREEARP